MLDEEQTRAIVEPILRHVLETYPDVLNLNAGLRKVCKDIFDALYSADQKTAIPQEPPKPRGPFTVECVGQWFNNYPDESAARLVAEKQCEQHKKTAFLFEVIGECSPAPQWKK